MVLNGASLVVLKAPQTSLYRNNDLNTRDKVHAVLLALNYFSLRTEGNVFLLINERLMLVMGWVQIF